MAGHDDAAIIAGLDPAIHAVGQSAWSGVTCGEPNSKCTKLCIAHMLFLVKVEERGGGVDARLGRCAERTLGPIDKHIEAGEPVSSQEIFTSERVVETLEKPKLVVSGYD